MTQRSPGQVPSDAEAAAAIAVVGAHLKRFYRDEPSDDVAARNAILVEGASWRDWWRVAAAFDVLFRATLPAGTLRELVVKHANRPAIDDAAALAYLRHLHTLSSLDTAVNLDDLV